MNKGYQEKGEAKKEKFRGTDILAMSLIVDGIKRTTSFHIYPT